MKRNIEERACELASYIIEYRTTVRDAAKRFGISKSTVHTAGSKWNGRNFFKEKDRNPREAARGFQCCHMIQAILPPSRRRKNRADM